MTSDVNQLMAGAHRARAVLELSIRRAMPRMRTTLRELALVGVSHHAMAAHFVGTQRLAAALRKQESGK